MRALYLLPVTFVMGIEGFDLFAPYLIGLMVVAYFVSRLRTLPTPVPVPIPLDAPVASLPVAA